MIAIERSETRIQSTYTNHAGDVLPQVEVTKYIHHVDGDSYRKLGQIRVLFTIRGSGHRYMAYAEAFKSDAETPFFNGNSLWHHPYLSMTDMNELIDSIIGMESLRKNFA